MNNQILRVKVFENDACDRGLTAFGGRPGKELFCFQCPDRSEEIGGLIEFSERDIAMHTI